MSRTRLNTCHVCCDRGTASHVRKQLQCTQRGRVGEGEGEGEGSGWEMGVRDLNKGIFYNAQLEFDSSITLRKGLTNRAVG